MANITGKKIDKLAVIVTSHQTDKLLDFLRKYLISAFKTF